MASAPRFAWASLGLVALGGMLGTAARAALLLIDAPAWQELSVPVINVVGALLLGAVTGWSARIARTRRAEQLRLLLGAGVMGGFTTYSTFAVQAVTTAALWITLTTVVLGTAAGWIGLLVTRPRRGRTPA